MRDIGIPGRRVAAGRTPRPVPADDTLAGRLWRLAMAPAAALGAALVVALLGLATWQAQQVSAQAADMAIRQAALAAASSLAHGDRAGLQRLAEAWVDGRMLASVAIDDAARLPVAKAGPMRTRDPVAVALHDAAGRRIGTLYAHAHGAGIAASPWQLPAAALLLLAAGLALVARHARRSAARAAQPIVELADAVSRFDAARPLPALPITGTGEVRKLQHGFNAHAAALLSANRDMRRQVEAATLELERKNAALETANQARTRFLAAASHDLRQPLSALTLFSSALVLGEDDPVRLSRIRHIQECVHSLDHLFNALLDLSRLEAGAMQPAPASFALDSVFDEASRTFRMDAEQRGLRLIMRKTDAHVHCDRLMLSRIVNNLVSNAIRYTGEGGVLVGARCRGDRVRIDVWDTGPGIAPELHERVFEEFFQCHDRPPSSAQHHSHGLGLGLSTVRLLCNLLAIPITLRSRPGRGTLFTIEVPVADGVCRAARRALPERPLDVTGLRVLAIDDEPAILEGLEILLDSWGCDVRTASCGEDALRIARDWDRAPDIVVSDLQLGGGRNGLEVINALQHHYRATGGGGFARLLITGETKTERLREISAARIPVLYKPVTPEQLREAMVAALALKLVAA
ncbi:hybrid sensor histidine kinase/response regulator [Luteimonas sp. BDR2-5]|uniref:ATP-binding response regulator n=1 Tax=Proluteimonas luteida TaxID=2878685 RepID=UPI001E511540|nr:hybrid sensor histidine kinase/response regulator [Luteimonas sp. BDR2-5]MCD9029075.1 hybrid sensor histidine kinase/response regulator [Luteimonas sp. BDR2-5]